MFSYMIVNMWDLNETSQIFCVYIVLLGTCSYPNGMYPYLTLVIDKLIRVTFTITTEEQGVNGQVGWGLEWFIQR